MSLMNHTRHPDEWLRAKVAASPLYELPGEAGKPTAIFNSGVVRLSYPHLITPVANKRDLSKDPKRSTALWFTPCHDLRPLYGRAIQMIAEARKVDPAIVAQTLVPGVIPEKIGGMSTPFHDQREKLPKKGYTPGAMYLNASTDRIVPVRRIVGGQTVPVADDKLAYGGIWAVVTFNLFISRENLQNQIPARLCAGLMAAFLFADDLPLGADEPDADKLFASLTGAEEIGVPDQAAIQGAFQQEAKTQAGMSEWGVPVGAPQAQQQQPGVTVSPRGEPLPWRGEAEGQQLSAEQLLKRSMGLPY